VKIKSVLVQGFRGFNESCLIELNERLTLIYAPNSYGKTSISEALEWLLYGITSKVAKADSKDEYKGSYRNLHLDSSQPSFVRAVFVKNENEISFTGVLNSGDGIARFLDDKPVDTWPLA
jgi:predicted ATP-dependent endonuclease of OLD family